MKTRILEFLRAENKTSAQLADEIGVQPSGISHIISGRNNPSLDFIIKMLTRYPSLSTDWLLFGKGNMYRDQALNDLFNSVSPDLDIIDSENQGKSYSVPQSAEVSKGSDDLNVVKSLSKPEEYERIVFFFRNGTFKEYLPVR